jgi:hypothetical protein
MTQLILLARAFVLGAACLAATANAQSLDVTIPQTVLFRADEAIE